MARVTPGQSVKEAGGKELIDSSERAKYPAVERRRAALLRRKGVWNSVLFRESRCVGRPVALGACSTSTSFVHALSVRSTASSSSRSRPPAGTRTGTSEMHFVSAMDSVSGIRAVLGLHETVCSGAADGYGRMARIPAMTLLHLGPGLANGLCNFHNARTGGNADRVAGRGDGDVAQGSGPAAEHEHREHRRVRCPVTCERAPRGTICTRPWRRRACGRGGREPSAARAFRR